MWNATDVSAICLEFIAPAGFEGFFEEMGALAQRANPQLVGEFAARYGQTAHPELIGELSSLYGVAPGHP